MIAPIMIKEREKGIQPLWKGLLDVPEQNVHSEQELNYIKLKYSFSVESGCSQLLFFGFRISLRHLQA